MAVGAFSVYGIMVRKIGKAEVQIGVCGDTVILLLNEQKVGGVRMKQINYKVID